MAILDVVGVATILPFMAVLSKPDIVSSNIYLKHVYVYLEFAHIKDFQAFLGLVFFVSLLIAVSFKAFASWFMFNFVYMCQYSLSRRLVSGYLHQPYAWFLNQHSADLGKTVLSEVDQVIAEALMPVLNLIAQGILVFALLILIVLTDPFLALAVVIFFAFAYGGIYTFLRSRLSQVGIARVNANRMRFSILAEAFGGIKDIKVSGLEDFFVSRFDVPALNFSKNKAYVQIASQLPRFALEILVFGGILLLVLLLTRGEDGFDKILPVVTLYAFAGYRLMPAAQQIYASLTVLRSSRQALNNLIREINALPNVQETGPSNKRIRVKNSIFLDNVTYAYPLASKSAINDLSIKVMANSIVGFVGATGAGKTTLADVMLGLLQPQNGRLVIDGIAITDENRGSWQQSIGYVPQNIYLADDTVAANIAFGTPAEQIDQVAVERAARIANLHDFVSSELPLGYETHVGERGVRLSGGQRQRIGIARALYRQPEVLILDEATSALDNLTERAVMDAVDNLGHEITIIIIAHRLSTVQSCDCIFILDKGCVVGQGAYDALVESNDYFRKLAGASME